MPCPPGFCSCWACFLPEKRDRSGIRARSVSGKGKRERDATTKSDDRTSFLSDTRIYLTRKTCGLTRKVNDPSRPLTSLTPCQTSSGRFQPLALLASRQHDFIARATCNKSLSHDAARHLHRPDSRHICVRALASYKAARARVVYISACKTRRVTTHKRSVVRAKLPIWHTRRAR